MAYVDSIIPDVRYQPRPYLGVVACNQMQHVLLLSTLKDTEMEK